MVASAEYPVHLGLAYLFLVGYFVRTVFVGLRLPGAVGVIVSGFAFSFFMQPELLDGRDHLQALAFFLVLLTAGTEISLGDLKASIIISATVPATFELVGIAVYAWYVLEWSAVESAVLGITLFGLGDGLVIPKMGDFAQQFPGHPLPRFLFLWAPLEASYALTLFGIVSGLAEPAGKETSSISILVVSNLLRLAATMVVGAIVGAGVGWLVSNRKRLPVPLTGTTVEAYLFILGAALMGFGISSEETGSPLVPMGFTGGSLFQPELMVIVIGCLFARVVDMEVLHSVELTMGGVWVFGQLVLFSMLGSRTDLSLFSQISHVVPILCIGIVLRFLGVLLVTSSTLYLRPCTCPACLKANKQSLLTDTVFCFLSTLPRATLQGALGQVPITERFFHQDGNRSHVQGFISMAARLYIVCMSVLGSVLLDALGPKMLAANKLYTVKCERQQNKHKELAEEAEQGTAFKDYRLHMPKAPNVLCRRKSIEDFDCRAETPQEQPQPLIRRLTEEKLPLVPEDRAPTPQVPVPPSPGPQPPMDMLEMRMAAWSNFHQLEGRMVEEPPPQPEPEYEEVRGDEQPNENDDRDIEAGNPEAQDTEASTAGANKLTEASSTSTADDTPPATGAAAQGTESPSPSGDAEQLARPPASPAAQASPKPSTQEALAPEIPARATSTP